MSDSHFANFDGPSPLARVTGLDVLRGVAALAVVFSHYINWWDRYVSDIPLIAPGMYGYYAVQLFFVISGIVIFNTLNKCRSTLDFAYRRFSRLYPTYWATLFGVALISALVFAKDIWIGGLAVNATMFQEFAGYAHFDIVYWSLSAELAFYVHVAWLFSLGWHRRIHLVCACWLLAASAWALTVGKDESRDLFSLLFVVDQAAFFSLGITLYHVKKDGMSLPSGLIIVLALCTAFLVEGGTGLLVALIALSLATLALWGFLRPIANSVTLWLGSVSFALYLVHRNLGYYALEGLSTKGFGLLPSLLLVVSAALALAWIVTSGIERPCLHLLRRWRSP